MFHRSCNLPHPSHTTAPPLSAGTRDFFPEDMRLRSWLFGEFASVSNLFGFEQFDAPVLESEELFVRKAGEEITEQLYNFEDKGGRRWVPGAGAGDAAGAVAPVAGVAGEASTCGRLALVAAVIMGQARSSALVPHMQAGISSACDLHQMLHSSGISSACQLRPVIQRAHSSFTAAPTAAPTTASHPASQATTHTAGSSRCMASCPQHPQLPRCLVPATHHTTPCPHVPAPRCRVALRPELTPSLARLVLQKGKALPLPAKWFAIGQCWRYERTTRGRRREHYQWNMDIVGMPGVEAEAELLAAITMFFSRVGLTSKDVGIKVSSRKVLQGLLQQCDVPEASFGPVCVIVDKAEKIPREEVVKQLGALGLPEATVDKILSVLEVGVLPCLEPAAGDVPLAALW
jgi:hypothetical protein